MSDSKRKDILDAVVSALDGITGIKTVTLNARPWTSFKPHEFPAIIVQDLNTDISRFAFLNSSLNDMEAEMEVACTGMVHDVGNVLTSKRTELISSIETTLISDTTLAALVINVEPTRVETDNGYLDNYSIFDVVFKIQYLYNHASP